MSRPERRVLAVIPARGGSKGLPGKNLAEVGGVPLIAHAVRFAASVPEITRTIVSTEDDQIATVAASFGAEVPFRRPAELAADDTPMAAVLRHALATVEQGGEPYDVVVLLMTTVPVRRPEDLSSAIARLASLDVDGVVSVSEPPFHPSFVGVRTGDGGELARYFSDGTGLVRRQDAGRYLRINGQFYVWRASFVRAPVHSWLDEGRHLGLETDDFAAADDDTPADLERLRARVGAGLLELPPAPPRSSDVHAPLAASTSQDRESS